MRGVIQLRAFVPLADARSESPGESVTRLRWIAAGILPPPELQIEVERPNQWSYWIDLGVEELRFGVEYDWARSGISARPSSGSATSRRRTWMEEERGWIIEPVTRENVFGHDRDIESIIAQRDSQGSSARVTDLGQMNRPVVRSMNSVSRSCSPFSEG